MKKYPAAYVNEHVMKSSPKTGPPSENRSGAHNRTWMGAAMRAAAAVLALAAVARYGAGPWRRGRTWAPPALQAAVTVRRTPRLQEKRCKICRERKKERKQKERYKEGWVETRNEVRAKKRVSSEQMGTTCTLAGRAAWAQFAMVGTATTAPPRSLHRCFPCIHL